MLGRVTGLLIAATMLTACREPGSGRDGGPFGDFASRGERALNAVSGRDGYDADDVTPYERGVRDGLREVEFDRSQRSDAYSRGYQAGRRELQRARQRYDAESGRSGGTYRRPRAADEAYAANDYRSDDYRSGDYRSGDYRGGDYRGNGYPPDSYHGDNRAVGASLNPTGAGRPVPAGGMRACADEVEAMFGLPQGSAAPVNARPRENGGFLVTVRAGSRRAVCTLAADGAVRGVNER